MTSPPAGDDDSNTPTRAQGVLPKINVGDNVPGADFLAQRRGDAGVEEDAVDDAYFYAC
ncbi:MAG: hypothetical protein WEB58_05470 [Planctomycetaceae bacterium]|jgi:hypothetical protein